MSPDVLIQKLVQVTREFNDKRISRKKRNTLIPITEAIRSELARQGRVVSMDELSKLLRDG